MLDAILAWIHFMLIFALSGTLFAEFFFYQRSLTTTTLQRLQRVDAAFGILAGWTLTMYRFPGKAALLTIIDLCALDVAGVDLGHRD